MLRTLIQWPSGGTLPRYPVLLGWRAASSGSTGLPTTPCTCPTPGLALRDSVCRDGAPRVSSVRRERHRCDRCGNVYQGGATTRLDHPLSPLAQRAGHTCLLGVRGVGPVRPRTESGAARRCDLSPITCSAPAAVLLAYLGHQLAQLAWQRPDRPRTRPLPGGDPVARRWKSPQSSGRSTRGWSTARWHGSTRRRGGWLAHDRLVERGRHLATLLDAVGRDGLWHEANYHLFAPRVPAGRGGAAMARSRLYQGAPRAMPARSTPCRPTCRPRRLPFGVSVRIHSPSCGAGRRRVRRPTARGISPASTPDAPS
jgi:hypothetical protein